MQLRSSGRIPSMSPSSRPYVALYARMSYRLFWTHAGMGPSWSSRVRTAGVTLGHTVGGAGS